MINELKRLRMSKGAQDEMRLFSKVIVELAERRSPLRILEAGCGQSWPLRLDGVDYQLTGVDLDEHALEIRKNNPGDLDVAVVGDLATVDLEDRAYDVIYNAFVLEHVKGAENILKNFARWLDKGGVLIMQIPDRESVYGLITRITPFWFHVFYKRYIQGVRNAGKPGYAPYPTFYENVVSRVGIHDFCNKHGLVVREELGAENFFRHLGRLRTPLRICLKAIELCTFGRYTCDHNDLVFVIEKP